MNCVATDETIIGAIETGKVKCVTLKLYASQQGYEFVLPGKNCVDATTKRFSYSERELLDYIERREVPYFVSDVLEECGSCVYYRGCVPVSVNDYRFSTTPSTRLIVLRPTLLSLLTDLSALINTFPGLDPHRTKQLEAKFWRLVAPPLHFEASTDPSASLGRVKMGLTEARVGRTFQKLLKRSHFVPTRKRLTNGALFVKKRLPLLKGMGGIFKLRDTSPIQLLKSFSDGAVRVASPGSGMGSWKPMLPAAKTPITLAQRKVEALENRIIEFEPEFESVLQRVEEITVEMPIPSTSADSQKLSSKTRIVVSKHRKDGIYYGQLLLESPPISSGIFLLGGEAEARLYVVQYLDMVTEAGRKQPKSVLKATPGKIPTNIVSPKIK